MLEKACSEAFHLAGSLIHAWAMKSGLNWPPKFLVPFRKEDVDSWVL